jgi:hypothetical protein
MLERSIQPLIHAIDFTGIGRSYQGLGIVHSARSWLSTKEKHGPATHQG